MSGCRRSPSTRKLLAVLPALALIINTSLNEPKRRLVKDGQVSPAYNKVGNPKDTSDLIVVVAWIISGATPGWSRNPTPPRLVRAPRGTGAAPRPTWPLVRCAGEPLPLSRRPLPHLSSRCSDADRGQVGSGSRRERALQRENRRHGVTSNPRIFASLWSCHKALMQKCTANQMHSFILRCQ